ncbi:MAG: hypothetical protein KIS92_26965 [Planctomycetota bacterium]|nr:hypothetical protein [Planctomycetota bacterium]
MPIQDDFIQRIIEEFGEVLRKLFSEREEMPYERLEGHLKSVCWNSVHLPYELVLQLREEDLLTALRSGESLRPHRYQVLGDLLSMDGLALEKEGRAWDALHRRRRALLMYAAAVRVAEPSEMIVLRRKADGLVDLIDDPCLSGDARRLFEENWNLRVLLVGAPVEPERYWLDRLDADEFLAT